MSLDIENKIEFSTVCRICLKSGTFLRNLFQTDAPDMLKFCGFLEVDECDEFPDKICAPCNGLLIQSYKLKQLCISSKSYLQSLLEVQKNIFDSVDSIIDPECNRKLENADKVEENVMSENASLAYKCSECGDLTGSKEHCCNVASNEEQNILKDNCDLSCDNKIDELPDEPYNGVNEVQEQPNDVKYQCPQCEMLFEHEQDVFVHQSIHGGEQTCNACKKTFKTMKILKRHLKTHMIAKSYTCKICNKGFTESSEVIKHARHLHLGIPRQKKYECKECGQRFTDQYYLKVHQRKHTGEKPLECHICDTSFYDPRSLKVHLDAHKGIKPYLCNYCGKSFVQNAHLRQHIVVHSQEKPYSCDTCHKRFTQSTSLQRHRKIHLKHNCDICSRVFLDKQLLFQHKEGDHGIKRKAKKKSSND